MNISQIRANYAKLAPNLKNISWRKLTDKELDHIIKQPQKISDCYCNATMQALLSSKEGRKIIRKRIFIQKGKNPTPAYKIILTPNTEKEVYRIMPVDYLSKYRDLHYAYTTNIDESGIFNGIAPKTQTVKTKDKYCSLALDIAIEKMLQKHAEEKEDWSKVISTILGSRNCEFNRPSSAFAWLTGICPQGIGETGLFATLNKDKNNARRLLQNLQKNNAKNYSYILLTGFKKASKKINSWHCVPILQVKDDTVKIMDRRRKTTETFSFEDVIKRFKAIVGINWQK